MSTLQSTGTRQIIRHSCRFGAKRVYLRLRAHQLSRVAFKPADCQEKKHERSPDNIPCQLAKLRTTAGSVLLACSAWVAGPAMAMQEFAQEVATDVEFGLGAEMMPDASIVTMATLVYISLAFLSIFLQSEEDPDDTAPKGESKAGDSKAKPKAVVSHPPPPRQQQQQQPQQSYSVHADTSLSSGPAAASNCASYQTARVQQLASSATSNVSMAIRDARYLLLQILPEHLKAVCDGAPPPSTTTRYPPVTGTVSMRGAEEGEVRKWLHGLVEAYLQAKQQGTGMARETAARVVLNNQTVAVRDISIEVAKEVAIMAAINIFNTMVVDPAFASKGAPAAGSNATPKV